MVDFVKEALGRWSHGAYGMLQAVWLARQNQLGNVRHLQDNIESLCVDAPSVMGFTSAVPAREMKPGNIRLEQEEQDRIVDITIQATINTLLVSLVGLFDEVAGTLDSDLGEMPGQKVTSIREKLRGTPQEWAARGVAELVAVRNVIVHGGGSWNKRAVRALSESGIKATPDVGDPCSPGVEDIFRYRRAVRTSLNRVRDFVSETDPVSDDT